MSTFFDVGVIGGLVSFDLTLADALARHGLRCSVAVTPGELERRAIATTVRPVAWSLEDAFEYRSPRELATWARRCRVVVSLTGALAFALGPLWFARAALRLPPVINFSTGSDVAELAVQSGRAAIVYRQYLRSVDLNWLVPYPSAIRNMIRLKIPRVVFMGFPYDIPRAEDGQEPHSLLDHTGPIRFAHASHLDWGVNDPGAHRASKKGNDRFIRAFGRAVRDGLDARCVILDRGPDRDLAHALVDACGISDRVDWRPGLSRAELLDLFIQSDVVVDQFDVGGIGGIAVEGMSVARPVLMHVDASASRLQYNVPPPVLQGRTVDEIHKRLLACADRAVLDLTGRAGREWVVAHHRWDRCLDHFFFYFSLLTGQPAPVTRTSGT